MSDRCEKKIVPAPSEIAGGQRPPEPGLVESRLEGKCPMSRRGFLAMAGGMVAAAGASALGSSAISSSTDPNPPLSQAVPFFGKYQAGILTPSQAHTYFAAFDLTTSNRADLIKLFQQWTLAASRLSQGQPADSLLVDPTHPASDSGDALDLSPARLTITFGLGSGLFMKDGKDRFGLAAKRPEALIDMPRFSGDQLAPALTGGDLSIQACADDPQVAFHAVRQLARIANGIAQIRWAQTGYIASFGPKITPRNLMGFKDGTGNPSTKDPKLMEQFVFAGNESPEWLRGGTYMVVRRIRMALEHWDKMSVAFQEQAIGRHKYSGAGLGNKSEFDPVNLDSIDKDGNAIIADNSHMRLAMPASNDGARILRRPYSYNDGANFVSERWPPWRQGIEYDAGMLFICYQKDVRTGFVKIFEQMLKMDMMNQFLTHIGGGLFVCPPGVDNGEFIAERLLA
jgi:deferrochelatase/peroxidase EfeB